MLQLLNAHVSMSKRGFSISIGCRCLLTPKSLSTLSQKSATVAENGERQRRQSPNSATVALFCDSVDRL